MSYYEMALDAGYRGEEARQYADYIEQAERAEYERRQHEDAERAHHEEQLRLLIGYDGKSLWGMCGRCQRNVDNFDDLHRVTAILRGGKGVECVLRGDIEPSAAGPLRVSP